MTIRSDAMKNDWWNDHIQGDPLNIREIATKALAEKQEQELQEQQTGTGRGRLMAELLEAIGIKVGRRPMTSRVQLEGLHFQLIFDGQAVEPGQRLSESSSLDGVAVLAKLGTITAWVIIENAAQLGKLLADGYAFESMVFQEPLLIAHFADRTG